MFSITGNLSVGQPTQVSTIWFSYVNIIVIKLFLLKQEEQL